ncbi:MAG: carboxy terminal-processing peptidase [Pseudomonadota bacterium]|nr:carboxy terminal-processing peptidase [Pseudomonadota bacterium]
MTRMPIFKKSVLLALILSATTAWGAAPVATPSAGAFKPTAAEGSAAMWTSRILDRYHYHPVVLDAALSAKILQRYFEELDPEHLLFTQADVQSWLTRQPSIDVQLPLGDVGTPFAIFALYLQRLDARMAYQQAQLKTTMDFTLDESFRPDRQKESWVDGEAALRPLWHARVKNDWLRLRLAGTGDPAIRTALAKRYDQALTRVRKLDSDDVFQIFMTAYTNTIEPHTDYFGPRVAEQFEFTMSLSLEGIGCSLEVRDDIVVIREIVPGSPAALSGRLHVGDKIMAVGQGKSGPLTDIVGWRLDDVVALVRGKKDSTVRLDVLPVRAGPDGKHVTLALVRNKISMAEQSAKKTIIDTGTGAGKRRIGVITLPAFYEDFQAHQDGNKDYKSATRDVAALLAQLKQAKVDGVLIDLRNNGGGALDEAVQLTGLFIDQGPVVQQLNAQKQVDISSDTDPGVAWDGPMGVLVNRGSASASEIFAAAIQDYGRGLILGSTSFGKGTVQTVIPLDKFGEGEKPRMGELKMTVAQFFRINGGTTQLRGVEPDIRLLPSTDDDLYGESTYTNALPYTTVKPAPFVPAGDLHALIEPLTQQHLARTAASRAYRFIEDELATQTALRKANVMSLNETVRRKERDALAAHMKVAEQISGVKASLDDGMQNDERSLSSELAEDAAFKKAKDVLLTEAASVVGDEAVALTKKP